MAVALSSTSFSGVSQFRSSSSSLSTNSFLFAKVSPCGVALPIRRLSPSVLVFARRQNRERLSSSSSPTPKKKKKRGFEGDNRGDEEDELSDDPFEALFNLLEEDLKNDKSSIDDEEISEEDLDALAEELAGVLGGSDEVDDIELLSSVTENVEDGGEFDDDGEDDDSEEDERPAKLKNWQLRRLAYALKSGRRKTSVKNLAAELCLERSYVLELLRDPPPKLLMLSATLPDEAPPVAIAMIPENQLPEPIPVESSAEDVKKVKEPVHEMQHRWSAQKRVKKAHIETLEKVYRRSKRPTNAVISSIVHVTKLPRKRVLKWFEDKRTEDGVPEKRAPYQAPV